MPDLLDELNKKEVSTFHKDFSELIRVTFRIDKDYKNSYSTLEENLPKYESFVKLFSKKYPNISLKIEKTLEKIRLRIFLKGEKNLREIFTKSAARISGLISIGTEGFGEADVTESEKIAKEISTISDNLYLSYSENEHEITPILLRQDNKQKMIEIVYDTKTVAQINSAEFKLITYYALSSGYKKDIDFYSKSAGFSFYENPTHDEKHEWLEKFNPRFHE